MPCKPCMCNPPASHPLRRPALTLCAPPMQPPFAEARRIRKQLAAAGATAPAGTDKLGDGGKPLEGAAPGYKPSPFDVHHGHVHHEVSSWFLLAPECFRATAAWLLAHAVIPIQHHAYPLPPCALPPHTHRCTTCPPWPRRMWRMGAPPTWRLPPAG